MKIPMAVMEQIKESNEENVLLLSMSTLPFSPRMYGYQTSDGKYQFNGITQLEAGTKYVLSMLANEGKKLRRIVIMATKETREMQKTEQGDRWNNKTAVAFYRDRIIDFCRGENNNNLGQKDVVEETRVIDKVHYTDGELEALFCIVPIDKDDQGTFFWNVIKKIKGERKDARINLYMDMQGGDRNAIAQMNAIVELLKDQNVKIKGRYAIRFNNNMEIQPISEVGGNYKTYDLITAMQVFKRYGWGQELIDYFGPQKNDRDKSLVEAIQEASDAIRLCDVNGFDMAVGKIGRLAADFGDNYETQLDIVFQDIKEDYGVLLDVENGKAKCRYVEQIRWCLKKGFVQQALTILEAKMPHEYVNNGFIYYCDDEKKREDILKNFRDIYEAKYKEKDSYKMQDLNHYFIRYYPYDAKPEDVIEIKYGCDARKINKHLGKYRQLCKKRNNANHALSSGNRNEDGFFLYMQSQYTDDPNWSGQGQALGSLEEEISEFLEDFEKIAALVAAENPALADRIIDLS